MKRILIVSMALMSLSSFAQSNYNCEITDIGTPSLSSRYSDDYELGIQGSTYTLNDEYQTTLSVEPYGFLTDIYIGDTMFDYQSLTISEDSTLFNAKITDADKGNELSLKIYKDSKKGVLLGKKLGANQYKMLATFDCNDYSKEMKLVLNADTDKINEIEYSEIPKLVRRTMSEVDLGFEMGDGYYDVISEKIYPIFIADKLIGYAIESHMSYTQDDDEEIYVWNYYLSNGIRFESDLWDL